MSRFEHGANKNCKKRSRIFFQVDDQCNLKKNLKKYKKNMDMNPVVSKARGKYLVSKPNYLTTQFFFWIFSSNRKVENTSIYE